MKRLIQLGTLLTVASITALAAPLAAAEEAAPAGTTETAATTKTDTFEVEGMTCGHCAKTITKAVNKLKGVTNVAVNVEKKQAQVTYDPAQVKADAIATAITASGYKAKLAATPAEGEKAEPKTEEEKETAPEPKS